MDYGVLIGAVATCAAGGIFPWINSEVVVIGASILLPGSSLPALVLGCASAQMIAKGFLYGITRWAPTSLPQKATKMLEKAERYRKRPYLLATVLKKQLFERDGRIPGAAVPHHGIEDGE